MNRKQNNVYRTDNYEMFKRLVGNRDVADGRVKRIIKSIQEIGYIESPIVVNESMEIIDGGGRLEALKRLGLPVDYIIVNGAGIRECIAMNINQTNWGMMDYINCYAESGDEDKRTDYRYLKALMQKYLRKGGIPRSVIPYVADLNGAGHTRTVNGGDFKCDAAGYEKADLILSYMERLVPVINRLESRKTEYYLAINFMLRHEKIDPTRLCESIERYQNKLVPIGTIKQGVDVLEGIYNYKLQANKKVYVMSDYQKGKDK